MVTESGQPIRILHLSDIHFRAETEWDAVPMRQALSRSIGDEVKDGLAPDLVAITGDIAFAGTTAEYALARKWLDDLWSKLGELPRDRLLLVPGNHDADRGKVRRLAKLSQTDLLSKGSQDEIATVMAADEERQILLERHVAYLAFLSDWLGAPQVVPWWQRAIEIRGTKLHVAGLNSAWMACSDDDRSHLLLGCWQVNQTVMADAADGAHWRIALLHHPWDYFAEFDTREVRAAIHKQCDLLLRGHLHVPQIERILPPDPKRSCLELAAGCVYENGHYPNAFQWIELWSERKRVRVLFRAWLHGEWTVYRNQPGCKDGVAEFTLATEKRRRRSERPGAGRSRNTEIPPQYLAWLQRNCADVSLLGQSVEKSQALTLDHVYVPALTRPAAPVAEAREKPKREEEAGEQKPVTLLQRLDAGSLYVPAAAGAGKSTFCRWATLQSIASTVLTHPAPAPDDFAEPVPNNLRGRLPLLVPLRDFSTAMDCGRGRLRWNRADLERALATWVDASPPDGLSGALLGAHLQAGTAFLLLDGLDEVPVSARQDGVIVYPRELLLSGLADALPTWQNAGNRILLTSRPYGLDEAGLHRLGLERAPLEPLPEPLQDLFVTRWFHALGKPQVIPALIADIRGRQDLAPLVENPMLLTALCVLYDSGGQLPEDRYRLYTRIVDNVLYHRFPGDLSQREPIRARLEAIALGMHTGDADAPRQSPAAEISNLEMEQLLRVFAREDGSYEHGRVEPAVQREELLTRSGLLLPRERERASFYHLSFQEFLAAERILHTDDDLLPVFRTRSAVAEWRPTLLFLFAGKMASKTPRWGAELLARMIGEQTPAAVKANPVPAVFIAEAIELCLAKNYALPDDLKEQYRSLAIAAIADEVEVHARQALGLCLGRVGDPRIRSLRDPEAYVEVPAGTYAYQHVRIEIAAPFRIGRYPVTNGQFEEFIDAGGYRERRWWSQAGWTWLQNEKVTEPELWHDKRWNGPNQPVVGVSFWEAKACCAWAGGRLPSEQEWEAAARGPKRLAYPWGNKWQDGICNTREAGLGVTSPVGLFPRSRQADFGIEDLAGNVWEWCASLYDAWQADFGIEDLDVRRVRRGGSWGYDRGVARSAVRGWGNSVNRFISLGFRVVCSSPSPEY